MCESGRAALCFLNGTCPFCKQKGRLPPPPPPRGQCIKITTALLLHLYIEDARRSGLSNTHLRSTGPSDAPRRQAGEATDKRCLLRFA